MAERTEIFGRAKIIVAESGAGIFNTYFADANSFLIEIRHPDLIESAESNLMLQIVGCRYEMVKGEKTKLVLGRHLRKDSYEVNLDKVLDLLVKLTK